MKEVPRVIFKADDRRDQEAICRGIDTLVEYGLLTDVAVIIQWTGLKERDLLLEAVGKSPLKDKPGIGIELHVNLVSGEPVSNPQDVPSLVDGQGRFLRPSEPTRSAWDDYAGVLVPDQVRREIYAQIDKFVRVFGHYPHALDSHHIILATPPGDKIAMQITEELGIPITMPKVFTDEMTSGPFPDVFRVDQNLLAEYKRRGIATVDWEEVEYWNRFENLEDSVTRLIDALGKLRSGITSFFFHPGHPDYLGQVDERFDRGRMRDFQILTHPEIRKIIGTLTLTSYKELFEQAQSR